MRSASATADDRTLRARAITTTCLVYLQILLGATMRHGKAGLAIPDFPLAFGSLIPPYWNAAIAMHFAHRVGAVAVLVAVLMTTARIWTAHRTDTRLRRPALLLVALVITGGPFLNRYRDTIDLVLRTGSFEATATTFFFRFKDDVVVRVRPDPDQPGGSIVDMRSISRVGGSDIGVNAARIRAFLADLQTA